MKLTTRSTLGIEHSSPTSGIDLHMTLQTEFDFVLPRGYVDERGAVHKRGTMRLATARDEILPMSDARVRANEAYLVIILLSQVIIRLGSLAQVSPEVVEQLFTADIAYLQDFYRRINDHDLTRLAVTCPHCGKAHEVSVPLLEE
jgi:hypothetical protein